MGSNSIEMQRSRQSFLRHNDIFVAKNSWWMADCPKHGETAHLGAIGGNCEKCQKERLAEPVAPKEFVP